MKIRKLIFGLAGTALSLMALTLPACSGHDSAGSDSVAAETKSYTPDFYEEWRVAGKLDLATMTVTKTISTERTAWYKIGDRIAVYSFDIYLRAYIDMEQLRPSDISIDENTATIFVKLPPVQSEITGRSSDLRLEYEDIGLFRSKPDSRERAALKEKANEDFLREFKGDPAYRQQLEATAGVKARSYFRSLGEAAGYKVEFVNTLPAASKM